jgi:electron transfer flavoprotein alpha subunit
VMMSIRPNAFEYTRETLCRQLVFAYTEPVKIRSAVTRRHVTENQQTCDIRDSEVLIAGGGGVKESFPNCTAWLMH